MNSKKRNIKLIIDNNVLEEYFKYYFSIHKRATKNPISNPYHESINKWMIMKRPMMNALKQKWKDFIIWFVESKGYTNLQIDKCEMTFKTYYSNNRRHDTDNSVPKFILDGLVDGGFVVDDDSEHITKLSLQCFSDTEHPRTEIHVKILNVEEKEK